MNSGLADRHLVSRARLHAPAPILLLATTSVALLVSLGIAMLRIEPPGATLEIFPLCAAFLPAILYAVAAYRFGHALFADADHAQSNHAWTQLLRISAILYGLIPIPAALFAPYYSAYFIHRTKTVRIDAINFRDFEGVFIAAIAFSHAWWTVLVAIAATAALLALWFHVSRSAFLLELPSLPGAEHSPRPPRLATALFAGGAMVLASLALQVNYSTPGWRVLLWKGGWVIHEFVSPYWLNPAIQSIMFAGYLAGLALAVIATIAAVTLLRKKSLSLSFQKKLARLSVVVLWFALTSYWGDCVYMSLVGILHPAQGPLFALVTAAWLAMFLLGIVLWFRYSNRTDTRSKTATTVLLVWMLPLMALPLGTFWYAAAWGFFGLILFVAGVQIVAISCAQLPRGTPLQSNHAGRDCLFA